MKGRNNGVAKFILSKRSTFLLKFVFCSVSKKLETLGGLMVGAGNSWRQDRASFRRWKHGPPTLHYYLRVDHATFIDMYYSTGLNFHLDGGSYHRAKSTMDCFVDI